MKTNKKLFLEFDESSYNKQINRITEISNTLLDAANELLKLDVKGYKAENLIDGNFLDIFHGHQKTEHDKPQWKNLGISYEKYLELRELDTTKLEELNEKYNTEKNYKVELYEHSQNIFERSETYARTTFSPLRHGCEKIMKYAPNKKEYSLTDLLSFKGNKAVIEVPKECYENYAINQSQIDLMNEIRIFVENGRKLGAEYKDLKSVLGNYFHPTFHSLSYDLKKVDFDLLIILSNRI